VSAVINLKLKHPIPKFFFSLYVCLQPTCLFPCFEWHSSCFHLDKIYYLNDETWAQTAGSQKSQSQHALCMTLVMDTFLGSCNWHFILVFPCVDLKFCCPKKHFSWRFFSGYCIMFALCLTRLYCFTMS